MANFIYCITGRRVGKIISLLVLVGSLSACLHGYNLERGIGSFKVQDYRQSFIRLKPEAVKGHADAQYAVGYMYYYGQGVVEDHEQAWIWINKAAEQGQPDAVKAAQILGRCRDPLFKEKRPAKCR